MPDIELFLDQSNDQIDLEVDNALASEIAALKVNKPLSGSTPTDGTEGQLLATNGDGSTEWVDPITQGEISEAVSDWLEENVDPVGSAVVVDSTLTIAGAAADSKAVGDKFSAVGDSLNNIPPYVNSEFTRKLLFQESTEAMDLVSPGNTNKRSVIIDHNRVLQTKTQTSPTGSTYYSFLMNKTVRYVGGNETSIKSSLISSDFTDFEYDPALNLYLKMSWSNKTESGSTARIPGAIVIATYDGTSSLTTSKTMPGSLTTRLDDYTVNLFEYLPQLKINKNIAVIYQSRYPNSSAELSIELYFAQEEPAALGHKTIALTENSGSASQAYATGDYLIFQDKLYKATSDIASGGAITPGTNVSLVTVGSEIKTLYGLVRGNADYIHPNFRPDDFVQFTDIVAYRDGWWTSSGTHGSNTYARTDLIPVYPGKKYYVTNKPDNGTQAAFFDANKDFVTTLAKADLVKESYQKPNGYTQSTSNYVGDDSLTGFFYFTVPAGCYYVSFNFNGTHFWHWTLCSKPIFAENSVYTFNRTLADSFMNGTAVTEEQWNARNPGIDVIIPAGDTAYQEYNKRRLCVIGPSTVMIDRRNPEKNGFTHFIVGWQEYMMPYYKGVYSYGYSGASWGDAYVYNSTYHSIHTMICGDEDLGISAVDLTGYDDFILTASANGLSTTGTGEWDTSTPDTDTYLGALRATVEYIYSQNSSARIWLMNLGRAGASNTNIPYVETIDTQLPLMCQKLGLQLIEYSKLGFNTWTRNYSSTTGETGWTYDGTHYNQTGSKMVGQFMRHLIVGR